MKKSISILTALFFLITTIAVTPAFAAPIPGTQILVEEFESSNFNSDKFYSTSQIFDDGQWNDTYIASEYGYNGGNSALNVAAVGTNVNSHIKTKTLADLGMTSTTALVLNLRFKFVGDSAAGFYLQCDPGTTKNGSQKIYGNADGKYHLWSETATETLNKDTWYNMSVKLDSEWFTTYIYDTSGNVLGYGRNKMNSDAGAKYFFRLNNLTTGGILFDDAKLYKVNSTDAFALVEDESTTANSVIATDGSVTLKFDQPINLSTNSLELCNNLADLVVEDSSQNIVSNVVDSVQVVDYNAIKVNFTGLATGTAYTLDFSNLVSAGGSALAETSAKTLAFSTEKKKVFVEEFNNNWSSSSGFGANEASTASEIFYDGAWTNAYVSATGYNGTGTALQFNGAKKTGTSLHIRPVRTFGFTGDNTLVFNIRFKTIGTATSDFKCLVYAGTSTTNSIISVGGNTESGKYNVRGDVHNGSSDNAVEIATDRWYNLSVKITKDAQIANIYDSVTGELIKSHAADKPFAVTTETGIYINAFQGLSATSSIVFDDATMYRVESTDSVSLINASIENGDEVATDGSIELTFDAPITATEDMFTIDGGAAIKDVKVKNFNTAVVSFTGLKKGEVTYSLGFAGLKSAGGSGLNSESVNAISFKTPVEDFKVEKVSGVITDGNVAKDSVIKVSVKNQTTADAANVSVIFAIKKANGTLIAAGMGGTKAIAASNTVEYSFNAADDYSDVDRIEVFTLDALSSLKPLANVFEIK